MSLWPNANPTENKKYIANVLSNKANSGHETLSQVQLLDELTILLLNSESMGAVIFMM